MRRNQKGRALGPYPNRATGIGWRVVIRARDGSRDSRVFASEAEARNLVDELNRGFAVEEVPVSEAIDEYAGYLRNKGRRESSVTRAVYHLKSMFADLDQVLADVGPRQAAELYDSLKARPTKNGKPPAVDTQRNCLNEVGTFARWAVKRGYFDENPFEEVEGTGRRTRGKPTLRVDEARKLLGVTEDAAYEGDRGALVVALLLLTGFRATETANLDARDVDDDGMLLWIDESKTEEGKRRMATPPNLIGVMREVAKEGGSLWPKSDRYWVRRQTRKWCKAAGVTVVGPQHLRATHSTLAQDHGATSHVVAAALGHTSHVITQRHYTALGTAEQAAARRAQHLLTGRKE